MFTHLLHRTGTFILPKSQKHRSQKLWIQRCLKIQFPYNLIILHLRHWWKRKGNKTWPRSERLTGYKQKPNVKSDRWAKLTYSPLSETVSKLQISYTFSKLQLKKHIIFTTSMTKIETQMANVSMFMQNNFVNFTISTTWQLPSNN